MRTWERTRVVGPCGSCNRTVSAGEPIQVIHLAGVSPTAPRRIRCQVCADGPIDDEQLEAFDVAEEGRTQTKALTPNPVAFAGATRPLFDAKVAAAGDTQ